MFPVDHLQPENVSSAFRPHDTALLEGLTSVAVPDFYSGMAIPPPRPMLSQHPSLDCLGK